MFFLANHNCTKSHNNMLCDIQFHEYGFLTAKVINLNITCPFAKFCLFLPRALPFMYLLEPSEMPKVVNIE